jgi:apocytochrome f
MRLEKKNFYLRLLRTIIIGISSTTFIPAHAYPIFAQQNYSTPREANGRIVCANCHLAQKPVEIDVPQAVLPNTVFEALVRIPYEPGIKQVLRNGKSGEMNVGAVIILPDGFRLAPSERIPERTKQRLRNLYFQPYSSEQENILVVGPVSGKEYQEIVFPILAPDPGTESQVHYLKYPVYLGGNRGRGQVYPDGSKSNNTVSTSPTTGVVKQIQAAGKKGGFSVLIETKNGDTLTANVPPGPQLLVKVGQNVLVDEPLTNNPNVGGFGQTETELVLQDPNRILGLLAFSSVVFVTQNFLVLKKKTI